MTTNDSTDDPRPPTDDESRDDQPTDATDDSHGADGSTDANSSGPTLTYEDSSPGERPADATRDEYATGEVLYETTPSLRVVLTYIALSVLVGGLITSVLLAYPELLGAPELTEIALYAVVVLTLVIVGRLLVTLLVLSRTTYQIRDDAMKREYELLMREESREIPLSKLRGHEYSQGRIQAMYDIGTVRFLTGGTNRSIGFLEFVHLEEPAAVRAEIQELFGRREEDLSRD